MAFHRAECARELASVYYSALRAGNITISQGIGGRARDVCVVLCTLTVRASEEVELIMHALHLHYYLARQRAGKNPRDVILAPFVALASVTAHYLDGIRLWTHQDGATVHLEK